MISTKEKAEKLLSDYLIYFPEYYNDLEYDYNVEKAKKCALIAQKNLLDKLESLNIKDEYEENVLSEIIAL
jgi:hypothetical protein